MADQTFVDTYPKATNTKEQVEALRQKHLDDGAKSSTLSEDATNWILTTVWPGDC